MPCHITYRHFVNGLNSLEAKKSCGKERCLAAWCKDISSTVLILWMQKQSWGKKRCLSFHLKTFCQHTCFFESKKNHREKKRCLAVLSINISFTDLILWKPKITGKRKGALLFCRQKFCQLP